MRYSGLRLRAALRATEFVGVTLAAKGMIDGPRVWRVAADDRPVAFFHCTCCELLAQRAGNLGI